MNPFPVANPTLPEAFARTVRPVLSGRCHFCGIEIEQALLPFCSQTCFTHSIFGEPELLRTRRIAAGLLTPADSDPALRHVFRPQPRSVIPYAHTARFEMIHKTRSYTLTDFERDTVKRLSAAILADKQTAGGKRKANKMGAQSDLVTNVVGFGGELAFCRLFNVCPDLDVQAQAGTFDCRLPNGLRIDVKTSMPDNPNLVVLPTDKPRACDVYVLMECARSPKGRFTYVGFIQASSLKRIADVRDLGHGASHIVQRHKLDTGLPL